jgi:DNA-directed RNA polymerase subunit E'/Rpb7
MQSTNLYINTILEADILLQPNQMDNNIYSHLKSNLTDLVEGSCFRNYGYVSKIYEILEYSDGHLIPENINAAAQFNIKFSCKLCRPIKQTVIVAQIVRMNKKLLNCKNGPVSLIVDILNLNPKFRLDQSSGNLTYMSDNKQATEVKIGDYILINVLNTRFNDKDKIIMGIGEILDIANSNQIKQSIEDELNNDDKNLTDREKLFD